MKFAKTLETTATELPVEWRPYFINYKLLKKCINKIVAEIETRGLIHQLTDSKDSSETQKVEYMFSGDPGDLHPLLKIAIESNDTSESNALLGEQLTKENLGATHLNVTECHNVSSNMLGISSTFAHPESESDDRNYIYVELDSEVEFFNMLTKDMNNAMELSEQVQREQYQTDISKLEKQITTVASPKNKDMYIWREIFRLYIEWKVFQGAKSTSYSKDKMQGFVEEIEKMKLMKSMKSSTSRRALKSFLELNSSLLVFSQFYTTNQMAVTKILKKHDKRSGLTASSDFPIFMQKDIFFASGMLEMVYEFINTKLVTIIPQLEDYCCPVCYSIAWRPIRLACSHVFCVRCLIKAQKKQMLNCPICRAEKAVGNADANNLDHSLQNLMQTYFSREIKEKRKENEREQAIQDCQAITGRQYTGDEACTIM
ncbi:hypothetical protein K450DRAFT_244419 [Umbelopsis ramanniana AG]|uniref:RING-type domain-containing protein n=1 Tax=Umbelopsis ramanniana AG TaxID=1314678 RepID=A0AAD5E9R3_UMBRA|nr:uncharacterized protein K450DRAFT_244419 [Umbelopsis ramanniana AG]KAI8578981.1 hypothetical protein K450DRAFT_244419 [Umbelopsis ramanniana AG]